MPGSASCASRSALAGLQESADILSVSEAEMATELEPHPVQHLVAGPVYKASGLAELAARHALSHNDEARRDTLHAASLGAPLPAGTRGRDVAESFIQELLADGSLLICQPLALSSISMRRFVSLPGGNSRSSNACQPAESTRSDMLVRFDSARQRPTAPDSRIPGHRRELPW